MLQALRFLTKLPKFLHVHVATLEPTLIFIHKCTNIHNSSIRNMVHKINNISIEIIVQINGNR